ncbi:hypothetical protein ABEB36_002936, partial [Hypothenemus hampei]
LYIEYERSRDQNLKQVFDSFSQNNYAVFTLDFASIENFLGGSKGPTEFGVIRVALAT